MDEYLSEKEQIEQIRVWWRENGWYLIGGALIAGIGYFGYGQYQAMQRARAAEASALYAQMQQLVEEDRPGADALVDQLSAEYPGSPYTDHARLLLARQVMISDPTAAIRELRAVMESSSDPQLAMVARLRLARVLAWREQYDEALALLDVESPGEFSAQLRSIEGDIQAARGDVDAARLAYTLALTSQGTEGLDQRVLQMKLTELAPALPPAVNPAAAPAEPAAAPAAEPAAAPAGEPAAAPADEPVTEPAVDTADEPAADPAAAATGATE